MKHTQLNYTSALLRHDDTLGQLFAIYLNVLRISEGGRLLPQDAGYAQYRASQWLRHASDPGYRITPPLQAEELSLDTADYRWKQALKDFAIALGRGTLEPTILCGIDYVTLFINGGSWLEFIFALYSNVLRMDHKGHPVNTAWATRRSAMLVRFYEDPTYIIRPPLRNWEMTLW